MEKKEAMKILKDFYDKSALFSIRTALDTVIPELKESEDEKIRKEIIESIKGNMAVVHKDAAIAYLEKQGEKTFDKILDKAKTEKQRILLTETDGDAGIVWDCRSLQDVKFLLGYGLDYIKKLEKQGEQKPAEWSKEDEEMRKRAIQSCTFTLDRTTSEDSYQYYREARDWLKSLPIGFIKNPNYNEDMVELLVCELKQIANGNKAPNQYDKEIEWLKSLRPKSQWKPTKEQLKELENTVNGLERVHIITVGGISSYHILKSLLEQLKIL